MICSPGEDAGSIHVNEKCLHHEEGLQLILNGLRTLLLSGARATRTIGTAVLSLCWVASGRANVYYTGPVVEELSSKQRTE